MIHNARGIGLILAAPTPEEDRGCRCGIVFTDEEITELLETRGEGLGVTLDEVRDLVGADRYDTIAARATVRRESGTARPPRPQPRGLQR